MTLIWMYLRRVVRNRENIVFFLVTPLLLTGAIIISSMGGEATLRVGVDDRDETQLTQMLMESLEENMKVIIIDENQMEQSLIDESINYALVIEKGYTEGIINGGNVSIEGYSIRDSNASRPVRIKVEDFINTAREIALVAQGDGEEFYMGMDIFMEGMVTVSYNDAGGEQKNMNFSLLAMNLLVMGMLIMGSFSPQLIIKDKEKKTFYRMLMAPLPMKRYMLNSIVSFFIVAIVQLALMLGLLKIVFRVDFNDSFLNIFVALLIFSAVCVSFGMWLSRISKNYIQASLIMNFFVLPSIMLGGVFWPAELMPEFLQLIGKFTPVSWIVKALEGLMRGASLLDVSTELGVVTLFAVVLFLVGSFRRTDVAK